MTTATNSLPSASTADSPGGGDLQALTLVTTETLTREEPVMERSLVVLDVPLDPDPLVSVLITFNFGSGNGLWQW